LHLSVPSQNLIRAFSVKIALKRRAFEMAETLTRWLSEMRTRRRERLDLALESIALHHQIMILKRSRCRRPEFRVTDRLVWILLCRWWPKWQESLLIAQAETVLKWNRQGLFQVLIGRRTRRRCGGRPRIAVEVRELISRMSRENALWGAPRIHGELLKLGFSVSQATVSRYLARYPGPRSPGWGPFLRNHFWLPRREMPLITAFEFEAGGSERWARRSLKDQAVPALLFNENSVWQRRLYPIDHGVIGPPSHAPTPLNVFNNAQLSAGRSFHRSLFLRSTIRSPPNRIELLFTCSPSRLAKHLFFQVGAPIAVSDWQRVSIPGSPNLSQRALAT